MMLGGIIILGDKQKRANVGMSENLKNSKTASMNEVTEEIIEWG